MKNSGFFSNLIRLATRFVCALLLVAAFGVPVHAQTSTQTQSDIDETLADLSEVLGALAHLEPICGQRGQARQDMQALLASNELSPLRQAVLIDAFNRGFRGVANIHQRCTDASERLITRHYERGAVFVGALLGE